jgi:two-component system, NarL family, response regulator DevR
MDVALVDDHEIVAVAVRAAVAEAPELRYVGAAGTVHELLEHYPSVDLVVLDLRLADGSSPVANVERLTEAGIRVLVLTSGESPYLVRSVARASVFGIVRKSAPMAVLVETLRAVAAGDTAMSSEWAAAIDTDPQLEEANLSAQELRVLELFARGVKAQVVAYELGIAVTTVDDYVRRIRAKYAHVGRPAHTKVDLYKRAIEDGILPGPTG